jgi:hypothetical protein
LVSEGSETALPALFEEFQKNLLGASAQKNLSSGVPKIVVNTQNKPSGPSKNVINNSNAKKASKK